MAFTATPLLAAHGMGWNSPSGSAGQWAKPTSRRLPRYPEELTQLMRLRAGAVGP